MAISINAFSTVMLLSALGCVIGMALNLRPPVAWKWFGFWFTFAIAAAILSPTVFE